MNSQASEAETIIDKKKDKRTKTRESILSLIYVALGAVILAICSWISIDFGSVPFTLQTFGVFLLLLVFGAKRGLGSILLFILMGAIGIPVFSGFSGGLGVLFGPTGGYILGFVLTGLSYLIGELIFKKNWIAQILFLLLGLALCYTFGSVFFYLSYVNAGNAVTAIQVLSWCVLPFLPIDLAKMAIAFAASKALNQIPLIRKALA